MANNRQKNEQRYKKNEYIEMYIIFVLFSEV